MELKDIVVVYHDQCRDGHGAAYAAWKKFGDTASYVPLKAGADAPTLIDKELYIVDFSFDFDTLTKLRAENKSVVVIDHHLSAKDAVTAFPENIFDMEHSGATLAWRYFHPELPVPELLLYVEDHDIWKFTLPENREFNAALGQYPMTFKSWDALIRDLVDDSFRERFILNGRTISEFEDKHVENLLSYREPVQFEGHTVYALNTSRTYRSILGHKLAELSQKDFGIAMGIVYYRNLGGVNISLRSEGDVDVSKIAQKYDGGGHKHAASIRVADFSKLPFTFLS
jgi:uncharacterized protein